MVKIQGEFCRTITADEFIDVMIELDGEGYGYHIAHVESPLENEFKKLFIEKFNMLGEAALLEALFNADIDPLSAGFDDDQESFTNVFDEIFLRGSEEQLKTLLKSQSFLDPENEKWQTYVTSKQKLPISTAKGRSLVKRNLADSYGQFKKNLPLIGDTLEALRERLSLPKNMKKITLLLYFLIFSK